MKAPFSFIDLYMVLKVEKRKAAYITMIIKFYAYILLVICFIYTKKYIALSLKGR